MAPEHVDTHVVGEFLPRATGDRNKHRSPGFEDDSGGKSSSVISICRNVAPGTFLRAVSTIPDDISIPTISNPDFTRNSATGIPVPDPASRTFPPAGRRDVNAFTSAQLSNFSLSAV
jgi:hypothetical protein